MYRVTALACWCFAVWLLLVWTITVEAAIVGVIDLKEVLRFDGRPVRGPQRIDTRRLVQDFGDVAATLKNSHAYRLVFDRYGAAASVFLMHRT